MTLSRFDKASSETNIDGISRIIIANNLPTTIHANLNSIVTITSICIAHIRTTLIAHPQLKNSCGTDIDRCSSDLCLKVIR